MLPEIANEENSEEIKEMLREQIDANKSILDAVKFTNNLSIDDSEKQKLFQEKFMFWLDRQNDPKSEDSSRPIGNEESLPRIDSNRLGIGGLIGGIFKGISAAIMTLFSPKAVIGIIKKFASKFGPIAIIAGIASAISGGISSFLESDRETLMGQIGDAIVGAIGQVVEFFSFGFISKEEVQEVLSPIADLFDSLQDDVDRLIGVFTGETDLSKFIDDISNFVGNILGNLWEFMGFDSLAETVFGVRLTGEKLNQRVTEFANRILTTFSDAFSKVSAWFELLFSDPVQAIIDLAQGFGGIVTGMGAWIYERMLQPLWEWFTEIFPSWETLKGTLKSLMGDLWLITGDFGEFLYRNTLEPMVNWFVDRFKTGNFEDTVRGLAGDYWGILTAPYKYIWDNVVEPFLEWLENTFDLDFPTIDAEEIQREILRALLPDPDSFVGDYLIPDSLYREAGIDPETGNIIERAAPVISSETADLIGAAEQRTESNIAATTIPIVVSAPAQNQSNFTQQNQFNSYATSAPNTRPDIDSMNVSP